MKTGSGDSPPYISESEIKEILDWNSLIDATERTLFEFSNEAIVQPVRQMLKVPGEDAFLAAMPFI